MNLTEVLGTGELVLQQLERDERFALFCEATRALPEQCRKVFILKKIYDLSHKEIAERLGISVSTTNQYLAKALARVTAHLREQGYLEESGGR